MTYYESVKHDAIEALIEITMDDTDLLDEVNYNVLCEILDTYDITGNMTGSYFCSTIEARQALVESEDTLEIIQNAVYHGFLTYMELGSMICKEEWEVLDVTLRTYVYATYISEWISEYIDN